MFNYKQPVFATAILFTFFISIIDGYNALVASVPNFELGFLSNLAQIYADFLPFYSLGLGWIVPAIIGAVLGYILTFVKR